MELTIKVCCMCGSEKPAEEFERDSRGKYGRGSRCKECGRARKREWHRNNVEREAAYKRDWRKRNRDRQRESEKRWKQTTPDPYRHARRRREQNQLSAADRLYQQDVLQGDPCAYCGAEASTVDHIVPLAMGGEPGWVNMTACCMNCNSAKHALPFLLFFRRHEPQNNHQGGQRGRENSR